MTEGKLVTDEEKFEHRSPGVPATIPTNVGPMEIMMAAVQRGAGAEQLTILKDMFEFDLKVKAQQAKEAFYVSKAAFKAEVPAVVKDKENKQYDSMYATEDALFNTVNPVLARHGLEASFSYPKSEDPKMFIVRCTLTHQLGHSEFVDADGPIDTSGSKNPLQQYKSTRTYLKKESYTAITGIASADSIDDDGNRSGVEPEYLTADMVIEITDMIEETGANEKLFLKWCNAESVEKILAKSYPIVKAELNKKKAKMRQPGE